MEGNGVQNGDRNGIENGDRNGIQNGSNLEEERSRQTRSKTILTSDNVAFNLEEELVASSVMIQKLLEDDCNEIRLPQVKQHILALVIDLCKKNATPGLDKAWEDEFLENHRAEILDLVSAADYLQIDSLMDLACRGVAMLIKGMTPEEVRATLGIENAYTQEEEEQLRREYSWAFE